ncbi:hypothetical protein KSC_111050 [Ktedonobacter sp. SOSP1-52]|nr:hypothetical protein KSC_111050 [Ktedonobacter sp. SOSP1-52]
MIALIGMLRYRYHHSLAELHLALCDRGIAIGERTVLNLLARHEELVSLHLAEKSRIQKIFAQQNSAFLALDGLRPDVGHEVLWVFRECVSGEILLARPLLSECEADLAALIAEVQAVLPVPIRGVISDGQHSIRNAVASALPEAPHQLCHFHYLREAAKPIYEADRHAKKELKKQVRGVRPIERTIEKQNDDEAAIIRSYCSAVRGALTDDGHPPLSAAGLKLHERLTLIAASLERVAQKRGLPTALERLHHLLTKGLTTTADLWPDVQAGYQWVHRAAHLLTNTEQRSASEVQQLYQSLLDEMQQEACASEPLRQMIATFLKVTVSYCRDSFLVMICLIFHVRTMTWNISLAQPAIMNGNAPVGNRHPLTSLYEMLCESSPRLPASAITSVGQNSNHTTSRNGEDCILRWMVATKLVVSSIVSERPLWSILPPWKKNSTSKQCGPRKKTVDEPWKQTHSSL